jgi:hypothetical protein
LFVKIPPVPAPKPNRQHKDLFSWHHPKGEHIVVIAGLVREQGASCRNGLFQGRHVLAVSVLMRDAFLVQALGQWFEAAQVGLPRQSFRGEPDRTSTNLSC